MKEFVRNMFVAEDEPYFFNRSDDLTRLELRRSDSVCVCVCICASLSLCVCVFLSSRGTWPVGGSCDPTGPEVCVFPTNLQATAKPQATLHAGV